MNKNLKYSLSFCFALLISWALMGVVTYAQNDRPKAYQLKAVFLYNFAQFVEWPDKAFASAKAPLVIGVLGKDPFDTYLEETIRGESINGHPLMLQRYNTINEVKHCQILYINLKEPGMVENALSALKYRNILSVSDAARFTQKGGIIQFITENNKIRMRINLEAAKASEMLISSKLLRVAEIASTKK